jgi:hypothetical protein
MPCPRSFNNVLMHGWWPEITWSPACPSMCVQRQIALFSLGTLCGYAPCRQAFTSECTEHADAPATPKAQG